MICMPAGPLYNQVAVLRHHRRVFRFRSWVQHLFPRRPRLAVGIRHAFGGSSRVGDTHALERGHISATFSVAR
jgi:hypothetical protein